MEVQNLRTLTTSQKRQLLDLLKAYVPELLNRKWYDQSPDSVHAAGTLVCQVTLDIDESNRD